MYGIKKKGLIIPAIEMKTSEAIKLDFLEVFVNFNKNHSPINRKFNATGSGK